METERRRISSKILFDIIAEQLAKQRQASFVVTGMSMWPLICHGRDSVIVESVDSAGLRKGDIVLLKATETKYLLHRVTKLCPGGFETTGDGNCFRDGMFPYETLVARVVKLVRNGKTLDCQSWFMRFGGNVWMAVYPCRRWIFKCWFRVRPYLRRK